MKTTITTAKSATAAILATFNCEIINKPYSLLKNMQAVKKALPQTDEYKHSIFSELIEIMQGLLTIRKVDFNDNLPAWAKKRLNDAFKGISTVACVLCDGNKFSPLIRKFVEDVISLANVQLEDMLIDTLPRYLE